MINDIEEISWAYLLDPCFELVNSAGKPLTGGYIEVYIHGTRNKYYCASDFNGTLHPFQIPLDSLGSNIILASPDNAYDIYVYNKFGNLVMSRYNVVPVGAGSGSGNSNFTIDSSDGTVVVTTSTDPETGVKTYDLSVPSVSGDASYWMGRGAATMGVNIEDTEYHDIQISSNSIRNEGEDIDVLDGKFSLKEGVYFWSVTVQLDKFESFDNTRQKVYVESKYNRGVYTMDMTNDESETVTFSGITVADHDGDTEGFKIKSEGTSPFRATLYHVAIHKLNHNVIGGGAQGKVYTAGDYIQITDDDVINVTGLPNVEEVEDMIESAITATASGYVYTAGDYISIDNREISVTGLQPEGDYLTHEDLEGYATETYVDNSVSSFVTESTVTSLIQEAITGIDPGEIYVPGQYVEITDENVINVTGLQPEGDYATNADVYEAIVTGVQAATSEIPDVSDFATHTEVYDSSVTSIQLVTGLIPDVSDYATHTEVYESIVTGIQAATGEIPDVSDFTTHAEVNESAVTSIQLVTGLIPDVTDFATHTEVYESTVTAIETVTAMIPEAQVQSDWTEDDTADPSYIQHKPDEYGLVAGQNIGIILDTLNREIVIAASGTDLSGCATKEELQDAVELVTGLIPDVSDFTTNSDVHESIVTAIEYVTGIIPDAQVQSNWAETDNTDPSYIQNKPNEYTVVAGNNIGIMIDNNDLVISASGVDLTDYTTFEDVVAMVSGVTGIGDYGQFYSTDITGAATMAKAKGTIDVTNDGKIKLSAGQSYHITVRGRYVQGTASNTYTAVSYIEYVTNNSINFNVDKTKTDSQYFELSYDLYKLNSDTNYYIFFTGVDGLIKDLFIEIHAIGSVGVGQGGGSGTEYDAGWGIQILNNVISVNPSIIPVVTGFATKVELQDGLELVTGLIPTNYITPEQLQDSVELVTGMIPDVSDFATEAELQDGLELVTSLIPDISNLATKEELQDSLEVVTGLIPTDYASDEELQDAIELVTGLIPEAQVQSDWTQNDNTQVDYIKNKPVEYTVVAGQNIGITIDNNDLVISASGTDLTGYVTEAEVYDATVTAVQTATGAIPDVSDMATKTWVGNQGYLTSIPSSYATDTEVYNAVVTGVQTATGAIPDVSDFVTEEEVTGMLPETKEVVFKEIDLSEFAMASAIPDVTNLASKAEVYNAVVTGVQVATGLIPDTSDMATKTWVGNQGYLTEVPSTYATDIEVSQAIASSVSDFVTESEVTALIPDTEDVDFEELDITQFAQVSAIPTVQLNSSDQVTAINNHPLAGGGGGGTTYTAGDYISIDNDVISVTGVAAATAIPETKEVEFKEVDLTSFALASAVVQSDWAVTAVDSPAYIQNKPTEKNLIAGANVTITESNDEVTIETTEIASGLQLVAGAGITITVSGNQLIIGLA